MEIPPPGPEIAGTPMMVAFDIDCGELIAGHHFVARGLSASSIPHPDDMLAWDEMNPRPRPDGADEDGSYFVSFKVPPGGFDSEDDSFEARAWRHGRDHRAAVRQARQCPGFDFHYELVPGLTEHEVDAEDGSIFPFLVGVDYTANVKLPWEISDGGAIAPANGEPTTPGSRGTWPIPKGARILTFAVTGIEPGSGSSREQPDGYLVVDLLTKSATWTPTT